MYPDDPYNCIEVGDHVRLKSGTKPIRITKIINRRVWGFYVQHPQDYPIAGRSITDFALVSKGNSHAFKPQPQPQKETSMQLYHLASDQNVVGVILATNSEGKKIFEERGTNKIHVLPEDQLVKIVPYTVQLSNDKHYTVSKDKKITKGDLLITPSGQIHQVQAVDTQQEDAPTLPANLRRLVTEEI